MGQAPARCAGAFAFVVPWGMQAGLGLANTVGAWLLRSAAGTLPWVAPLPPALAQGRAWVQPGPDGPRLVAVVPARAGEVEAVRQAIRQFGPWLDGLHAPEGLLILVGDRLEGLSQAVAWTDEGPWRVWWVDEGLGRWEGAHAGLGPLGEMAAAGVDAHLAGEVEPPAALATLEEAALAGRSGAMADWATRATPVTWFLSVIVAVTSLAALSMPGAREVALVAAGAAGRAAVAAGEWWRVPAALFLHGHPIHLAVNLLGLLALGPPLERLLGPLAFAGTFLAGGLAGMAASLALHPPGAFTVGASGALFGLVGAWWWASGAAKGLVPAPWAQAMRREVLLILVLNGALAMGLAWVVAGGPRLDHAAHLGGLAGGYLAVRALGLDPRLTGKGPSRLALVGAWGLVLWASVGLGVAWWGSGGHLLGWAVVP